MNPDVKRFGCPPLVYLSVEQMQDIHSAALDILEDHGTVVHNKTARELLKNAGADRLAGNRVCIPGGLIQWAIDRAPHRVTIYNRNGNPSMFLEGRNVYFGTGSDCPNLLDSFSGRLRPFAISDVADAVRLVDALPHIDFVMSMGLAAEVPERVQYQQKYALMLQHSIKPQVITAADLPCLQDITEMAAVAVGGPDALRRRPIFVLYDEPSSPLVHSHPALEKLMFMARHRLPTNYAPGIMAGGTSPVTMAGAVVQAVAEILSGLVIHQLTGPGAPFVFGAGMSPLDMRSMQPTYAAPEAMMTQAAVTQIGRELYRLPTWGFAGCSASKLADEQAVIEAGAYILMSGWMGTNLVHDVGYLEFGLTFSYDLLAMCDEMIGQLRRLMEGIDTDRSAMAVEVIKRVGAGGHFLDDDHTFDHFRSNWQPDLIDRNSREVWQTAGATTMAQRAKLKIQKIIAEHRPEPLNDHRASALDKIVERARHGGAASPSEISEGSDGNSEAVSS
jgi:trimethylamine--corrinoid protein Co-methyltransferase